MAQNHVYSLVSQCPAHPLRSLAVIVRWFESSRGLRQCPTRCMIEVEGLGEATPIAMDVHMFRDPREDWCIRIAAGKGGQHISFMPGQHWYVTLEATFAANHMYQQLTGLIL